MPTFQITRADAGALDSPIEVVVTDKPVTIGRNPDNTIPIRDERASRYHCVIEPDPSGRLRLRDLGSRDGTRVNGVKVLDHYLAPGDSIRVGSHEFSVQSEATLQERQAEARGKAPATDAAWLIDLRELIRMLPPKDEWVDEPISAVDGRGKPTPVLEGNTAGPTCLRMLLIAGSKSRATDIHCEPKGEFVQVRLRVDGQMVGVLELPNSVADLLFGVIKTACQFPPASKDTVLDGSLSAKFQGRRIDYRISFTPSMHGQKLVVRILDQRDAPTRMADLDLPPYMHERLRRLVEQDAGMLLVCGPTGSGKTTTLYNALREIDRTRRNVVTIEDPIEYHIEGVTQIPADDRKGNSFGSLLRSVLRQDPDVILVGEIRDEETARTAMQAAMTGHLVFSTVHSKDTI